MQLRRPMQSYPELTIATTIHNNLERWMEMALSLEREVGLPCEIVVVDDGSATLAEIKVLKSPVRLLRNAVPKGFCGASNQALMEVKTPFALLLDADITFLPGDFHAVFESFKSLSRLAWCNFMQVSKDGQTCGSGEESQPPALIYAFGNFATERWWKLEQAITKPVLLNDRVHDMLIAHSSSTFVRMEAFRQINGFDLRYWQCQSDNDVCLRLKKAGWQVGLDQIYTVQHDGVGGKTGGTRRVYDLYRGRLLLYETHEPFSRVYLRILLSLRHLAETIVALFSQKKEDHLRPSFRFHLALSALRGYPR
jgi:N-acetylglucosaminyl-diphospho-decaprenol L-rhamnosyltransferase